MPIKVAVCLIDVNSLISPVLLFMVVIGCARELADNFNLVASSCLRPRFAIRVRSILSILCLNPYKDPAVFKILYSGFNISK
jgi:hypothetical protein